MLESFSDGKAIITYLTWQCTLFTCKCPISYLYWAIIFNNGRIQSTYWTLTGKYVLTGRRFNTLSHRKTQNNKGLCHHHVLNTVSYNAIFCLWDTFTNFNYFSIRDSLRVERIFLSDKKDKGISCYILEYLAKVRSIPSLRMHDLLEILEHAFLYFLVWICSSIQIATWT